MAQIAILGLGTVGTSLGLALRKDKAWANVVGYDPAYLSRRGAVSQDAVRSGADSIEAAVRDADVVILTGSAVRVAGWLREIAGAVKRGCVVTDTSSAKAVVMEAAREALPSYASFVGGHPSVSEAGRDGGIARPDLFRKRTWYLTPAPGTREDAIELVCGMVEVAEGVAHFVDASEHDSWCAAVEQLPAVLAVTLVTTTAKSGGWREMQRMASVAYREASELATSDAAAREDMVALYDALAPWLAACERQLREIRGAFEARDEGTIAALFAEANGLRASWLAAAKRGYPDEVSAALDSVRPTFSPKSLFRRRT